MLKAIFTLILSMAVFNNCFSQETLIDKNKVLDFFQNQQFEEALEYLGPIYATQPDNIQVMNYLGYAQYMLDDYREAKKIYQQIFSIDSNNISANQYLAIITYNQDADECLSFYQRLHNLEPSKAVHCRHIGELWSRKNNSDSALYYFQKAYYMTPKDYRNAVGFAGALLEEKQYNRTDSILEAGLKLDSLNGSYLRLRVKSAYEAGDY
ncbi:MAG TPA: tetratricopeptide repeat protein, partial [Flavitalea sp.]|nr:tetratricopeptide repeat protein [Flavitalea sp.]